MNRQTFQTPSEAVAIVEKIGVRVFRVEDRIGLRETHADVYRLGARIAFLRHDAVASFNYAQLAKSRTLLELFAGQRSGEDSIAWNPGSQRPREGKNVAPTAEAVRSLGDLVSVLRDGEALLDFLDVGDHIVLYLLTPEGLRLARSIEYEGIAAALEQFREEWELALQAVTRGWSRDVEALLTLYELLIQPLEDQGLLDEVTRLVLSPSGRLHSVPFAALCLLNDGGELSYLYERYELMTVPTASSLWMLGERKLPVGPPTLLAVAPFASLEPPPPPQAQGMVEERGLTMIVRDGTRQLPYTGWEVREVARLLGAADEHCVRHLLVGADGTRRGVEQLAPTATLVLLATHGTRGETDAGLMDYRLLFEPLTGEAYRTMSMREVYNGVLSLQGVFQVYLSACHLGEVVRHGEEAMGFQQGFLAAGARVAVAPLWAVSDATTAVLSVEYHRALIQDGVSAARAMQVAMEKVRTTPGWEHPFFWAAMLPSGDGAMSLTQGARDR